MRLRRIHIQQIRAFRQQTVRGPHAQVSDFRGRQLAAARLVRQRGIEIPVGDDHRAALQSGQNHFRDVLRAVGGEQQRLRTRGDVGTIVLIPRIHAVQQHFANRHAQCGAARLARDHAFAALRFNICAQPFDLRGLAHAVNAFKRDKSALHAFHCTVRPCRARPFGPRLGVARCRLSCGTSDRATFRAPRNVSVRERLQDARSLR